jgi:DNA-binding transcriptional MerR regulator
MANASDELVSVGGIAQRTGLATSTIKYLESRGEIPASIRVIGDNRRVWLGTDVTTIERYAARRAERLSGPEAT